MLYVGQHPWSRGITEIRTVLALPQGGPYSSNDPLLGCYPTHKVPAEHFYCIWRIHYLAEFLCGKQACHFLPPSYLMGILRYELSITGKEIKIKFLPVLYIRTPSPQSLHTGQSQGRLYFGKGASLGWYCPTDIKVIGKVMERQYWNTLCFTIHRAHPPILWPHIARPWEVYMCAL